MEFTLLHDHLKRKYFAYVPRGATRRQPVPLLCLFHGGGSTGEGVLWESRFLRAAQEFRVALLVPDGSPRPGKERFYWNDGRWWGGTEEVAIDDAGAVLAMADDLLRRYAGRIDAGRQAVAGYSNGAHFAYTLAKRFPTRFRAVAAIAGHRSVAQTLPAGPVASSVSVLQFSGCLDPLAPFRGGFVDSPLPFTYEPVADCLASWSGVARGQVAASHGDYQRVEFGSHCTLYLLPQGAHTWPGGRSTLPAPYGQVSRAPFAAGLMCEFVLEELG